jgi:uncharacterized protein (UPF0264 family)
MTRLLISVRNVEEALDAAGAGADFIDLKEPSAGALGGLSTERILRIVQRLRALDRGVPISATIGDWSPGEAAEILSRVQRVAACGVDYVKVGIPPHALARELLGVLARADAAVVPVLIADDGVDSGLVDGALAEEAFPAVMLDTADKRGGSLLQRVPQRALAGFVQAVQGTGRLAGLAGALRAFDVPALQALAPDFAGFRSAVCDGDRAGALDAWRVRDLARMFRGERGIREDGRRGQVAADERSQGP